MSLFPTSFVEDVKSQTDIVTIIGEVTPLRKAGATFKGLCPFHQEKTPSFNVHRDKGFFKCFGCGAAGDVVKFLQLHEKVTFPEAVRTLALRAGLQIPEREDSAEDRVAVAEREALVKLHEVAAEFFGAQLASPAGLRARRELESRGLTAETIKTFGYGYAPAGGRETLTALFAAKKVPVELQIKSSLVAEREGGRLSDQFRNRLMIPIARDSGAIIAFGGRALEAGQQPKYLNSRETPIYSKGRTLYGLHVTKGAVRKENYCVLVEGYFDLAQVWQAGGLPVVALCGTALTSAQARALKRFTSKVVLSLDPDAAGQGAAARSSELLVTEGFQVNVALLPEGTDPDTFIRKSGGRAYVERLTGSRRYLDFLLDRASEGIDMSRADSRKTFIDRMLAVAATIPDAVTRDQFADRLSHKAAVSESVVRDEIKKAAGLRKTESPVAVSAPAAMKYKASEQGLIWALIHRPVEGLAAIGQLEEADFAGLATASVLRMAANLVDVPPEVLPNLLRERLTEEERLVVERAAQPDAPAAAPGDCVNAIKRDRCKREIAAVQQEIDRFSGRLAGGETLDGLWRRKMALTKLVEDFEN